MSTNFNFKLDATVLGYHLQFIIALHCGLAFSPNCKSLPKFVHNCPKLVLESSPKLPKTTLNHALLPVCRLLHAHRVILDHYLVYLRPIKVVVGYWMNGLMTSGWNPQNSNVCTNMPALNSQRIIYSFRRNNKCSLHTL